MDTKHTPGALQVVESRGARDRGAIHIASPTYVVATMAGKSEEARALATCFAAAPDLLEALRAVTDKLSGCYIEASAVDGDPALIKARAAIAKAEGR